jgi:hypothetical protein
MRGAKSGKLVYRAKSAESPAKREEERRMLRAVHGDLQNIHLAEREEFEP